MPINERRKDSAVVRVVIHSQTVNAARAIKLAGKAAISAALRVPAASAAAPVWRIAEAPASAEMA
jgi:post-segregation antitoxin (ccd killing protein)